ncbi:DUF2290 domain-containing protein [Herbaspirillum huttiense]|uniref:DUF2290 domain-containing protein n=1 Tax=Herbaspirillum huttiense TaxID=863372 RepID=UPI0037F3F0BE
MTPESVLAQMRELYSRAIASNLSVKQYFPSEKTTKIRIGEKSRVVRVIGDLASTSALKNVRYADIYADVHTKEAFHLKLPDGGLLAFQYIFDNETSELVKHRLAYFPCDVLPTVEEAPELYAKDELFGDIVLHQLVRFPIRFDFDPDNHVDLVHPICHLTLGQYQDCRIPVAGPILPYTFLMFVLRNFYSRLYLRHKNLFDKRIPYVPLQFTITPSERRISHFVMGRNWRSEYDPR